MRCCVGQLQTGGIPFTGRPWWRGECGSQKADWKDACPSWLTHFPPFIPCRSLACRSEPLPFRLSQRWVSLMPSALPSSKLTLRINPVLTWRRLRHTFSLLSLHTARVRAPMRFTFTQKKVYSTRCSQSIDLGSHLEGSTVTMDVQKWCM